MRSVWSYKVWRRWDFARGDAVACSAAAARLSEPQHPPTSTNTSSNPPAPLPQLLISTPVLNPTTLPLSHSLVCVCNCVWSLLVPLRTHAHYISPRPGAMDPQPIMFIQSQLVLSLSCQHWPFCLQCGKRIRLVLNQNRCSEWRFLHHFSIRGGSGSAHLQLLCLPTL